MTKEEKQRGLELQGYINSIKDMTIKEIAIKYLKKHHLPKFLARLLVKFSTPLLLAKDYELRELEKENAELKAVERMALYSKMSDRLAKAEELLLELYDCIPSSMADSCKETLQKVALFFKDSEVEK